MRVLTILTCLSTHQGVRTKHFRNAELRKLLERAGFDEVVAVRRAHMGTWTWVDVHVPCVWMHAHVHAHVHVHVHVHVRVRVRVLLV